MTRNFVMTSDFDSAWKNLGLNDEDLRQLQNTLARDPNTGDMIQVHMVAENAEYRLKTEVKAAAQG